MHISTFSDEELLEAVRRDDEKAFAELFKRYWRMVDSMAYSRTQSADATQEIVQNLFISLWEKRASLTIKHLPSYLHAAVKNRVLNYIDSQITRKKHWDYYKQFIPTTDSVTDHQIEFNELAGVIESGMRQLPEKSRQIFKLHRLEGLSIREIANSLNLSEKAIQYHITQSVKRLKFHLKDYMFTGSLIVLTCC